MTKRPLIIVPVGLQETFTAEAWPENITPFAEVREIDPTDPGSEDFADALNMEGEYAPEMPEIPEEAVQEQERAAVPPVTTRTAGNVVYIQNWTRRPN